jgi:uncharacterized protein YbaR (Trm112 family)
MISKELLDILACPACDDRPSVRLSADKQSLVCDQCGRRYPIREDIPVMLIDEAEIPADKQAEQG